MNENRIRCPWVDLGKEDYIKYHDMEWGVPVYDDKKIFEFLVLESAQAGLNWYTILRKREGYRQAFSNFNAEEVACFDEERIQSLIQNPAIIRNKLKIRAAVNNAAKFLKVQEEFGSFSDYIWRFVNGKPIVNYIEKAEDYQATSKESEALSKDLIKRGFKFVGPTIVYAHMQATGMVNDHTINCFRRQQIIEAYD